MARRLFRFNFLTGILVITLFVALLEFAFLGFFIRYMADDWCTAAVTNEVGLLEAQRHWYGGWTGRFSFSLAIGIANLIGPKIVPLLPASALALWLIAASWASYQIALVARWPGPLLASLITAELIVFATLNTAHNIVQSFYWQTGVLTYIAPLIFLTFYVGVGIYAVRRRLEDQTTAHLLALGFVATFIAGGFSEAFVFLQTGVLLLAVVACYTDVPASFKRTALPPIVAGLVGSSLVMLIVVLAPGNDVRQSFFPPTPNLISLAKISLYYATGHIPYTIYLSPFTTLLMLIVPAVMGFYLYTVDLRRRKALDLRKMRRLLVLLPIIGYILILLCYVPAAYGMSTYLPGRARIIPQFVFVCVTTSWGYLAGTVMSKYLFTRRRNISRSLRAGLIVVIVLLILSPVAAVWRVLTLVKGARESASTFDQMDREIRAAKERGIVDQMVTAVDDVENRFGASKTELHIEHDAENWKNKCVARFYGIRSVKTR